MLKNMFPVYVWKTDFYIMVSQYVWIGIAVGVFVVGIGIDYAALQGNSMSGPMNFGAMSPQQMQQAMQDPDFSQNMMNQFKNNPQSMQGPRDSSEINMNPFSNRLFSSISYNLFLPLDINTGFIVLRDIIYFSRFSLCVMIR